MHNVYKVVTLPEKENHIVLLLLTCDHFLEICIKGLKNKTWNKTKSWMSIPLIINGFGLKSDRYKQERCVEWLTSKAGIWCEFIAKNLS